MRDQIELCGQSAIPFGARLLFAVEEQPLLTFHVEICEDLWVPIPPSSYAALAGATVLLNPSGSPVTVAQGRIPARAGRKSVGPMHGGLSICRRRRGRIDHRPCVGRTGSHLRKRQPARRVAALQPRPATHLLGDRSRAPLAGADAPDQLRADGASSSRCAAAISPDQILDANSRGAVGCFRERRPRALPLRAVGPCEARRAMLGGLRNPGARAGDAAARDRASSAS